MRKSFTRLFSLVMFLTLLSSVVMAGVDITSTIQKPKDDGADKVYSRTTDKIRIGFSEAVKAGTGYVRLTDATGAVRAITANDARISYAIGDTVVIDLSADQKELVTYTVSVDNGTFVRAGATAGNANVAPWSYTVGDYTGPKLTDVVPVKGATVDKTISLVMTFEDASDVIELGTGKIAVYKEDGNVWDLIDVAHAGTHSVTISDGVLTVTGIRGLEDLTNYAVTIGAGVVVDGGLTADGKTNAFAGVTDRSVWTFSSKDFSVPGYATDYPKVSNIGVTSFDLLVKTTEAGAFYAIANTTTSTIDASLLGTLTGTTAVTLTSGVEAKKTFSSLTKNTDYYVYLVTKNSDVAPSVSDIKGPIKVTTIDTDKPVLGYVSYFKDDTAGGTATVTSNTVPAIGIDQATNKIVFDFTTVSDRDKLSIGSGSILIYKKSDNTVYTTIDASAITINDDHNAVATLSKAFENRADYYAFIPSTLFKDEYNNFYGGITTTTGWTFSTNDIIAPSVVSYDPIQGADKVKKDKAIVVKFSEVMSIPASGTTSATYFTLDIDGETASYTYTHSTNNNAFSTVTITSTEDYPSTAVVTITVNGDIKDLAGNKIGLTQGSSFVAEDYVGPTMEFKTVPTKTSDLIVVKFDEPIYLLGGTPITASNLYTIVTLKDGNSDGVNVAATYAISDDKKTITITPTSPWVSNKTYYVAISSDVQDVAENKCVDAIGDRSRSFTINDIIPAVVTIDKDGKTDVTVNSPIIISFKNENDEADLVSKLFYGGTWTNVASANDLTNVIVFKEGDANGANVPFTVTSADGATFSVTATGGLTGAKTYYIGVGASTQDAHGNVNVAKFASFTTLFVGAPEVVSLSPVDNSTEIGVKTEPVITFNTNIKLIGTASYTGSDVVTLNGVTVPYDKLVVSGKTLTIKHTADFDSNKEYEILIPSTVVLNTNSPFAGINAIETGDWTFTTVDKKFEAFTITPDYLETPELDAKLVITVPEKVIAGTGNVSIKNADTDYLIESISSTSSQVEISYDSNTSTITITPSANFVYGGKYYVEVDKGTFVDMYANQIPAIVGKTSSATTTNWTFTAKNSALAIDKVTPTGENVATDADIVVTFNREIKKGTAGSIGFKEYSFDGSTLKQDVSYGITSTNLVVSGKTLTIKHSDKLFSNNSKVYLMIEANSILANTLSSTVSETGAYSADPADGYYFYVGDALPPVATVVPTWDPDTENYVQVNTNVTITFNEDVLNANTGVALTNDNVSFAGGIIQLLDGTMTPTDFQGSISGRTITLDPTSNLAESTTYTVRIVGGTISDTHSHADASNFDVIFKTVDTTLPTFGTVTATATASAGVNTITVTGVKVTDLNPNKFYYVLKNKSEVAPTIDEVKAANAMTYDSGVVFGLDPITNLLPSTTYVLYYAADDAFGNTTTVKTKEIKTVDTVAPVLVSTDPVNGTVNVNNDKAIVFTFDEPVEVGSGKVYIKDKATNSLISTIVISPSTLTATTSEKAVKLITGFPGTMAPVEVYVEMDKGAIKDKATDPNDFAGIFGSDKVYFTYEDNQAPVFTKFEYTGTSTSTVELSSNIVLNFSENVQAGTANVVLHEGTTTTPTASITSPAIEVFKGTEVSISGKVVTINPTLNFKKNTNYFVEIQTGFVKDLSSNKNSSVSSTVSFSTTIDVAPTIASINPEPFDDKNKSRLERIELTFSDNVYLTIAGLKKSLTVLTEGDVKSKISFTKADGTAVPYLVDSKTANSIVLTVSADKLEDLTSYVLTVGGFESLADLVMDTKVFNYTTGDGLAPTIVFNPADKTKNVVASSPLTMTFSETIYADITADGKYFIPFTNDNVSEAVYLNDITDVPSVAVDFDVTFNGTNKFTIVPAKALLSGHKYEYGLTESATVTDSNGNFINDHRGVLSSPALKSASMLAYQTWAGFTVLDTDKPKFAFDDVTPAPGDAGVKADAVVSIKFNEKIAIGTGSIMIRYEDGTIFETISGAGLSVDADDAMLLNVAHKNFDSNAVYFVEIGEGVVTDLAGNKNVALTDPTKWTFTTKDTFDLTANVTPIGENTPRTVSLTLSFNKVPEALGNKFLSVYTEDGTAVYQKAVSEMSIVGKDAIYSGVALAADQAYYARVEAGAFKDAAGNKFAGIMDNSWVFSTVDNIAPKVVTLAPADNATGVDTQTSMLTMTFDRNIALGTGVISVRYVNSGLVFEDVNVSSTVVNGMSLTINLTKMLDAQTAYYVIVPVGAITNTEVTKDSFAGILNTYTWNFTTATDLTAPTAIYTPNGTTTPTADSHPSLQMTFNEDVTVATGNVKVYKASDNTVVATIPVTASMLSGKTVSLTYANGLERSTDYYVLVDAGVVKDLAGNDFAGVTASTTWTFKTGADWKTPVVPEISDSQFKVYPNPFVDYVTVSNASELSKVVISNIAGQIVKEVVAPESTIQLNELRSGVYFISLYQDGAVIKTVKLLKR